MTILNGIYFAGGLLVGTCLGLNLEKDLLTKLKSFHWRKLTKQDVLMAVFITACIMMVGIGMVCLNLINDLRNQSRLGRLSDEFSLEVSEATVSKEKCQNQLSEDVLNLPAFDPRRVAIFRNCQVIYFNTVGPLNKKRAQVVRERNAAPK